MKQIFELEFFRVFLFDQKVIVLLNYVKYFWIRTPDLIFHNYFEIYEIFVYPLYITYPDKYFPY